MNTKNCPICSEKTHISKKYPYSVCSKCSQKTVDENDNKIEFFNIDYNGGFYSIKDNIKSEEHICYINGIQCYAEEARFGGIVVSLDKN
tara:strand:- start:5673 stop:5939 length:267 start_codon:yes stop_codon:yes gene_type:complete